MELKVVGHVECRFGPFRDRVSFGVTKVHGLRQHTIGSEIILDAPDDTPR
jgi:hypothetical protein